MAGYRSSGVSQTKLLAYVALIALAAFILGVLIAQPSPSQQRTVYSGDSDATTEQRINSRMEALESLVHSHENSALGTIITATDGNSDSEPAPSLGQRAALDAAESAVDHTDEDFSHITLWSTDFHITPIADLKFLFNQFGITVIDKSLSGACGSMKTCAKDLKVLNGDNGYHLGNEPHKLSKQMFDAYQRDDEFKRVDGIVCFHPIAQCQLYMPFNKSLLMISSTRYEHGQHEPDNWRRFNKMLQIAAGNPRHLVAGNSVYDADYIKYFTNIDALYIPSFCGQITARYNLKGQPRHAQILLGHSHVSATVSDFWPGDSLIWEPMRQALVNIARSHNDSRAQALEFKGINELYRRYEYQDLANHPAIVHLPYQVSVMSMFEQYRMNIPLFYPSLDFLVELQAKHAVLSERTWARVYGHGQVTGSDIEGHDEIWWPDPNNDRDNQPMQFWLAKSDFYVKPHIVLYSSWADLVDKLIHTDLDAVSAAMEAENARVERKLKRQWKGILHRLFRDRPTDGYAMPKSFEDGMRDGWGMEF